MKINSNINAHIAANALSKNQRVMGNAMERLSTGVRINSARDDAAGLAITSKMTSQINGLKQAVRNTNDAISMVQTAASATQNVVDMLQRLRELAVQAANGSNTASDKAALQQEANQIIAGIDKIATQTQWNGVNLLDGTMSGKFQVGANPAQTVDFSFENIRPSMMGTGQSEWVSRGSDIVGENYDYRTQGTVTDGLGSSVSISKGGNTIALGGPYMKGNGPGSGGVRIFDWDNSSWVQRGSDIDGELGGNGLDVGIEGGDQAGHKNETFLSNNGNTVAIGAHLNDGGGEGSGHVRVFDWSGSKWVQRGLDIDGESAGDASGRIISMSEDGNTLAIGAPANNGGGTNSGHVRIFDWTGLEWVQRGLNIIGGVGDAIGMNSISSDGNTIAISGVGVETDKPGNIRVYDWNGTQWIQRGLDIEEETYEITLQNKTVLSSDGNTLVHGASDGGDYGGSIRVFDWNGASWVQRGADIQGESNQRFGSSISISTDGNIIAFGAIGASNGGAGFANGLGAGLVRVLTWDGYAWTQSGEELYGNDAEYRFGWEVSLSGDGSILAAAMGGYGVSVLEDASKLNNLNFSHPSQALSATDQAIQIVTRTLAGYGALHNRLEYAADNLTNIAQNTEAARSRILDTDYASETTELARTQIIQQAATAMLTQANQQAKYVLELLKSV